MKKLFLVMAVAGCVCMSQAVCAKGSLQVVGIGVRAASSPYRGINSRVMPIPLLRFDYKS